eukprot:7265393-Prymnesium_polylepis.3
MRSLCFATRSLNPRGARACHTTQRELGPTQATGPQGHFRALHAPSKGPIWGTEGCREMPDPSGNHIR